MHYYFNEKGFLLEPIKWQDKMYINLHINICTRLFAHDYLHMVICTPLFAHVFELEEDAGNNQPASPAYNNMFIETYNVRK